MNRESTEQKQDVPVFSDLTARVIQGLVYGLIIGIAAAAAILGALIAFHGAW